MISNLVADGGRNQPSPFLTAEWRNLVMLNYEVDPGFLHKLVPAGTELDTWNGRVFISLVGFLFLNTRVFGLPMPFHRNFEEVNLRFYVRRQAHEGVRRGVVFIREIVPRFAIATVARVFYNENYVALPTSHRILNAEDQKTVEYSWKTRAGENRMLLRTLGDPSLPVDGSEEQFITEHYWGYAKGRTGGCTEYRVTHPAWRVWQASEAHFAGDMSGHYGKGLAGILASRPSSAFLAEGSAVTVYRGTKMQ
jgi:uncharacterized protein YqjF (DUF2071 family)